MRTFPALLLLLLLSACATPTSSSSDDAGPVDGAASDGAPSTGWLSCGSAEAGPVASQHAIGELATMGVHCQGTQGPVVLLLHGFPDFAYGWHKVMAALAPDHIVVAPNQRGYYTTSGPDDVDGYKIDKLVEDIAALVKRLSAADDGLTPAGKLTVVGHDWGGAVAWTFAHTHPELLDRLVIINGPHPDVFIREYNNNPEQKSASSYMSLFRTPGIESTLRLNEHKLLVEAFGDALSEAERAVYRDLFAGSVLTRMLNWYRANLDTAAGTIAASDITVDVPTLVAWGMQDTALLPGNLKGLDSWVKDLTVQRFPTATHWVPHEQPVAVAKAIADFTAGLPIPPTATEQ